MARIPVLLGALLFTAALGAFTVRDLVVHGATLVGVVGAAIVLFLAVALIGALLHPPSE